MVTELMEGGGVEGIIEDAEDHRLPLDQAIKTAQETYWGMEFAHSRGIIHGDLKPGNVVARLRYLHRTKNMDASAH